MLRAVEPQFHSVHLFLIFDFSLICISRFWLPGGRVDPGEGLMEAALRETREEAGVDVDLTGVLSIEFRPQRGQGEIVDEVIRGLVGSCWLQKLAVHRRCNAR